MLLYSTQMKQRKGTNTEKEAVRRAPYTQYACQPHLHPCYTSKSERGITYEYNTIGYSV